MALMQAEIESERVRAKAEQERRQKEYENTLRDIAKKKEVRGPTAAATAQSLFTGRVFDSEPTAHSLTPSVFSLPSLSLSLSPFLGRDRRYKVADRAGLSRRFSKVVKEAR